VVAATRKIVVIPAKKMKVPRPINVLTRKTGGPLAPALPKKGQSRLNRPPAVPALSLPRKYKTW